MAKQLGDGTYLRQHIHGDGAIAPELKGYIPVHDHRYAGVVVRSGRVVEILMQDPPAPKPRSLVSPLETDKDDFAPIVTKRAISADEVVVPEAPETVTPTVSLDQLKLNDLRALAKQNDLNAGGGADDLRNRLRELGL